ncbi:MAG: hypothetical protein QM831_29860 [Kofleriaceae bacterium]
MPIRVPDYLAARERGDLETEDRFFSNLRLRDHVFKLTYRHRFDDTLAATARLVRSGRVLDLGCSSGVAAVELAAALPACEVFGSDRMIRATYLERDRRGWLLDDRDRVIQVDGRDWAMSWFPSKRDIVFRPLRVARSFGLRLELHRGTFRRSLISLVSSTVAASGVTICEEDALRPQLAGTFQLIRVANFWNRLYFTTEELRALRDATISRLTEGGVLFVVRTHDDRSNHGTFFERRGGRLHEIERVGQGSDVTSVLVE